MPGQKKPTRWTADDIVSGFNSEATQQIPWGYGLMRGPAGQNSYVLPSGASGAMEVTGLNVFQPGRVLAPATPIPTATSPATWAPRASCPRAPCKSAVRGPLPGPRRGDGCKRAIAASAVSSRPGALFPPGIWGGTNLGGSYVARLHGARHFPLGHVYVGRRCDESRAVRGRLHHQAGLSEEQGQ